MENNLENASENVSENAVWGAAGVEIQQRRPPNEHVMANTCGLHLASPFGCQKNTGFSLLFASRSLRDPRRLIPRRLRILAKQLTVGNILLKLRSRRAQFTSCGWDVRAQAKVHMWARSFRRALLEKLWAFLSSGLEARCLELKFKLERPKYEPFARER